MAIQKPVIVTTTKAGSIIVEVRQSFDRVTLDLMRLLSRDRAEKLLRDQFAVPLERAVAELLNGAGVGDE
jgi:hypothetical protein